MFAKSLPFIASIGFLISATAFGQATQPGGRRGPASRQSDVARHFGDAPDDPGPIATDLSPGFTKSDVLKAEKKVADWELERGPEYFNFEWTYGPLYSGFLVASQITGDRRYHDSILEFGNKNKWMENPASQFVDPNGLAIGQAYLDLYFQHKDAKMLVPTELALDDDFLGQDFYNYMNGVPQGGAGFGGFGGFGGGAATQADAAAQPGARGRRGPTTLPDANNPQRNPDNIVWWWSDALYMAPGTWLRTYKALNNPKYLSYADKEWWNTSDHLFSHDLHLFYRDETYKTKKEANGQPMLWSRGNGWVMGAFPHVIPLLPANFPHRQKYIDQFKEMSARLAELQGPDGLWRAGLLDQQAYDLPENSGSSLILYGMAWGINYGILDAATYRPVVEKGWKGLLSHVYADGRLGSIQQTGEGPAKFKASSSFVYGVGGYLMLGGEIYQMSK